MDAYDMPVNSIMRETRITNACSLKVRSHYPMTTRVGAMSNTGTNVRPTGAFRTRPARMASDRIAGGDTSARACQGTDFSSGPSCSWSRSRSPRSSRRGTTNDPGSRRVRFACLAMGDPGSARRTRGLSRRSRAYHGLSLASPTSRSRWPPSGSATRRYHCGGGGDIGTCPSTKMRRSSGLRTRKSRDGSGLIFFCCGL